jgi:hypothetical protein
VKHFPGELECHARRRRDQVCPQEGGVSSGRSPDGSADIRRLAQPTPGTPNSIWRVEDVVINEIMYNPISGDSDEEYIELYNRGGAPVTLDGWRLEDGVRIHLSN